MTSYVRSIFNYFYSPPIEDTFEVRSIQKVDSRIKNSAIFCNIGGVLNVHLSKQFSLADFRATENADLCKQLGANNLRQRLIQYLELDKSLGIINQYYPFLERINQISTEILGSVSLHSLQQIALSQNPLKTAVSYALIDDETFLNILIEDLTEADQVKLFKARLAEIRAQRPDLISKLSGDSEVSPKMRALNFESLSAQQILANRDQWPAAVFGLVTDSQRQLLDFGLLSPEQIRHCVGHDLLDEKVIKERINNLSSPQLVALIKTADDHILPHIPKELLKEVPFSEIEPRQIQSLFCNGWESEEKKKEKIVSLSPAAINAIIPKLNPNGIQSDKFFRALSDTHIVHLDYSQITPRLCQEIFFYDLCQRKVALVPMNGIIQMLKNQCFGILEHLSDAQLPHINLQSIPQKHLKLLFPPIDPVDFHPGFLHSIEANGRHLWQTPNGWSSHRTPANEVRDLVAKNKATCQKNYRLLATQSESVSERLDPKIANFLRFLA